MFLFVLLFEAVSMLRTVAVDTGPWRGQLQH